ncbi:MAG: ECF-type sigma factor, partial [Planctomycetota bacterium]
AELLTVAERKLARLPRGLHDFEPHSLVHDAYVRLMEGAGSPLDSRSEVRFAMNRAIHDELVESARRAASYKHGGVGRRVEFDSIEEDLATTPRDEALLEVHEAVMKLKQNEPVHARIVTLRFFGGLTMEEIAEVLDCSVTTVERKWRGLKEWLARELRL